MSLNDPIHSNLTYIFLHVERSFPDRSMFFLSLCHIALYNMVMRRGTFRAEDRQCPHSIFPLPAVGMAESPVCESFHIMEYAES